MGLLPPSERTPSVKGSQQSRKISDHQSQHSPKIDREKQGLNFKETQIVEKVDRGLWILKNDAAESSSQKVIIQCCQTDERSHQIVQLPRRTQAYQRQKQWWHKTGSQNET